MANNQPVNQYKRDHIRLYPNGQNETFVDIKQVITDFSITESVHQHSLMCTMNVMDGLNMLEDLQLEGDEYIDMQLSKDTPEGKIKYKHKFYIADIINYVRPKPGVQTYQLICVSEHAYLNQLMLLNRKFEGNIGKLVKDILVKDLNQEDTIGHISNSTHTIKGIYPSLRPVNAIQWLTRNAFDNGYPYFFYETLRDNAVTFTSLKELANASVEAEYEQRPYYNDINPMDKKDQIEQRKKVLSVSTPTETSIFNSLKKGAYGSSYTSIDISTKEYVIDKEYRYDDSFIITDNKYRSYKKSKKFLDKGLEEFVGAKDYNASLNSLAFTGFKNYHDALSENIQNASSKTASMEASQINVNVCGDPRIAAGTKIRLKIPKSIDPELNKSGSKSIDNNKSGVYIVYDIEHKFSYDQEYFMNLHCRKDTSNIDYDKEVEL